MVNPVGITLINHFAVRSNLLKSKNKINRSVLVSKSGFSRPSRNAANENNIELFTINDLKQMIKYKLHPFK
jgi:hypothetical protein